MLVGAGLLLVVLVGVFCLIRLVTCVFVVERWCRLLYVGIICCLIALLLAAGWVSIVLCFSL